eukprot:3323921-Pleurochrysis_carterae.AAC.4
MFPSTLAIACSLSHPSIFTKSKLIRMRLWMGSESYLLSNQVSVPEAKWLPPRRVPYVPQ